MKKIQTPVTGTNATTSIQLHTQSKHEQKQETTTTRHKQRPHGADAQPHGWTRTTRHHTTKTHNARDNHATTRKRKAHSTKTTPHNTNIKKHATQTSTRQTDNTKTMSLLLEAPTIKGFQFGLHPNELGAHEVTTVREQRLRPIRATRNLDTDKQTNKNNTLARNDRTQLPVGCPSSTRP